MEEGEEEGAVFLPPPLLWPLLLLLPLHLLLWPLFTFSRLLLLIIFPLFFLLLLLTRSLLSHHVHACLYPFRLKLLEAHSKLTDTMADRTRSPREPRQQIPKGQTDTGKGNVEEKGRSNDTTDATQLLLGLGLPQPSTPTGMPVDLTPEWMFTPGWDAETTYTGTRTSDTANSSTDNVGPVPTVQTKAEKTKAVKTKEATRLSAK